MTKEGDAKGYLSMDESNAVRMTEFKTTSEKAKLVDTDCNGSTSGYRVAILTVSWVSVIGLGILGVTTLAISIISNSSSSFAFALDAWLDCLSSIIVLWRFFTIDKCNSAKRERIACIALGCLFMLSSLVIITKSSIALHQGKAPKQTNLIWYLSVVNAVSCVILMVAKAYLAKKLRSIAVLTDAVNSLIGFVLAISTLVSDYVSEMNNDIWFLDSAVGIGCSFFLLAYGIWVIIFEVKYSHTKD